MDDFTVEAYNNILMQDDASSSYGFIVTDQAAGNVVSNYNNLYNADHLYGDDGNLVPEGLSDLSEDPLFVSPDFGYVLRKGSPCIDAGDNAVAGLPLVDYSGNPRIMDGDDDEIAIVDLGARELGNSYEFIFPIFFR